MFFTANGGRGALEKPGTLEKCGKFFLLSLLLFALALAAPAEARVGTLYKWNAVLGPVPVMDGIDGNGGIVVSIADAGALLGLNASVAGEELLLSRGTDRLRIVLNAVAAWHNTQLIPLYGASYVQEGRWWLDVPSSLSLLQRFAGREKGDRLRVEDNGDKGDNGNTGGNRAAQGSSKGSAK